MTQRPVTLADIVRGHVSLEIEGFDRLYFNGWVPTLQTSGQIAGWLHWRGFRIASPAALGRNAQEFRAAVRRYADGNQIPWVVFRKGDRKLEVIRPYLDAAEKAGQSKVVAIGEAREFQWVFDATKSADGPARLGVFLDSSPAASQLSCLDRQLLERYLADLHAEYAGRQAHIHHLSVLNGFFTAIRRHGWDGTLPASKAGYPEDWPRKPRRLPRALAAQIGSSWRQAPPWTYGTTGPTG
jgi:hypothetical protein